MANEWPMLGYSTVPLNDKHSANVWVLNDRVNENRISNVWVQKDKLVANDNHIANAW